jgi:hypothetical protein
MGSFGCHMFKDKSDASSDTNDICSCTTILFGRDLDVQQGLFKLMMKSNVIQAMVEVSQLTVDKVNPRLLIPIPICGRSLMFITLCQ